MLEYDLYHFLKNYLLISNISFFNKYYLFWKNLLIKLIPALELWTTTSINTNKN